MPERTPYEVFRPEDVFILDKGLLNEFKNSFRLIENVANRLYKIEAEITRRYLRAGISGIPLDIFLNPLLDTIIDLADNDVYIIKNMIVDMERKNKVKFGTLELLSQHLGKLYSNLLKISELCDKMGRGYDFVKDPVVEALSEVDSLLNSDFINLLVPVPDSKKLKLKIGPELIEFVRE